MQTFEQRAVAIRDLIAALSDDLQSEIDDLQSAQDAYDDALESPDEPEPEKVDHNDRITDLDSARDSLRTAYTKVLDAIGNLE